MGEKNDAIYNPDYPGITEIENVQGPEFKGCYIPWVENCLGAVKWKVVSANDLTKQPGAYWTGNKEEYYLPLGHSPEDGEKVPWVNIEHVCESPRFIIINIYLGTNNRANLPDELQILPQFFADVIDSNHLNCNAFRGNFVKSGKLQEIFNKVCAFDRIDMGFLQRLTLLFGG